MSIRYLAIIIASSSLFAGSAHGQWSASRISRELAPSVVRVISLDRSYRSLSFGTGFFLNPQGVIATNHHVLLGGSRAVVKTSDHRMGEVLEILNDDPELDLLIARTSLHRTKPVNLGNSDRIRSGDRVFCLGHPAGSQGTITRGMVLAVRRAENMNLLQITAPLLPGGSGGPVFDDGGDVIGIATAYVDLNRDLNFAMPVNYLKGLRPSRSGLSSLSKMPARLEAAMRDDALVEILVMRDNPSSGGASPPESPMPPPGPGVVHFKSGRKMVCDMAWKEDETVFLVMHGKRVAVGYDERAIDMKRSFIPPP